jgi:inhibitor of KinA
MRFFPQGEGGLVLELGDAIDPAVNARVHHLARALRAALGARVEVVPTYRSLLVVFDPLVLSRAELEREVAGLEERAAPSEALPRAAAARRVELPVLYGGEHGPDLADVAAHAGLTEAEVVRRHAAPEYLVHLVGFTPGFPYLGGLDPRLATPRLATPRREVPAGSVAIGGAQTGVYPVASPGGWRLIGRTPLRLFDPARGAPFLVAPGDLVRFVPVDASAFGALAAGVEAP